MKNFYVTLMLLLMSAAVYAATITAVVNGNWNSAATWDLGRVPAAGDVVVIPSGLTVTVTTNTNLTAAATAINVNGNLVLSGGKLNLANGSVVRIYTGGTLSGTGCNCETLSINGSQKYNGTQGTINGPAMADATSAGFIAFAPLPVKFSAYTVVKNGNDYQVSWTTTEEVNAAYYEVQRSEDGKSWKAAARIAAAGNSSTVQSYSHTDRNVTLGTVYYRVKQADQDGRAVYTTVKTFKNSQLLPVYITTVQNQVNIRFTEQAKGAVEVNVVSMNGQIIASRSFNNSSVISMPVSASHKGQYIVRVRYNESASITRQVIF